MRKSFGLFILCVLFIMGTIIQAQDAKAFVGDWNGAVSIGGMEIDVVCHFQLNDDGTLSGTIDSPSQGAFGLALSDIQVDGKKITFGIDDPNVPGEPSFTGSLDDEATTISGDFSQGGGTGTFELTKE